MNRPRPFPALSFWQLNAAGWTAFMVAMSLSRIGRFPIDYMIATKAQFAVLGLLLTGYVLRPLYRRLLGDDASLARVIVTTVVLSYATATVWTILDGLVDRPIGRTLLGARLGPITFWSLLGGNLYNTYTILAWSLLYIGIKRQQALLVERERAVRAETLAQKAQLDALRWQLNPHFLFNALNAISTLVIDGRSREAAAMIARLGDLLRSTLEMPAETEISLAAEIELMRRYLDLEQVRLGDRLSVDVAVDDTIWKARVPSLVLQPIVENAVRHAIAPRTSGGRINVSANRTNGRLQLVVEDDGPGIPGDATSKPDGIGLTNTRERLRHLYGDAQHVALDRGALGGLRVRLDLPYRE